MTVSEALLNCISAALDGRECALTLAPDDWTALLRLAGEQKLLPLVYAAVRGTPGFAAAPEAVRAAARRQTMREAAAQTVHTEAFLRLYQALRAEGLAPVVVKGIVCRALYPQPELRPSSDEDLYLTAAEMPHFHAVLLRAGFVLTEPERDYRSAHEARYVHPDTGLVVEGHWALFPTEYAVYAALNVQLSDLMQRAQDWETGGVTLRVPDACDHLIFLLLHAFKHFISSGVGVRQLCDIALWMRRFGAQIDWQRVRAALRATHSEGFAAAVIDAGVHWFGLERAAAHIPPDWETLESAALLADALSGGVYGSADSTRRHSCTITIHAADRVYRGGTGRASLCAALFPGREVMAGWYPYVARCPALLPAAWAQRIWRYLRTRGKHTGAQDSLRIGAQRVELLRQYRVYKKTAARGMCPRAAVFWLCVILRPAAFPDRRALRRRCR